jgi:hypothetical protein
MYFLCNNYIHVCIADPDNLPYRVAGRTLLSGHNKQFCSDIFDFPNWQHRQICRQSRFINRMVGIGSFKTIPNDKCGSYIRMRRLRDAA